MNRRYSPWFFSPNGLCFAEYTVLTDDYFVAAILLYALTSAACGLAGSLPALVAARILPPLSSQPSRWSPAPRPMGSTCCRRPIWIGCWRSWRA